MAHCQPQRVERERRDLALVVHVDAGLRCHRGTQLGVQLRARDQARTAPRRGCRTDRSGSCRPRHRAAVGRDGQAPDARPHADPIEYGKSACAQRQVDSAARAGRQVARRRLAFVQIDLITATRQEQRGNRTDQSRTRNGHSDHSKGAIIWPPSGDGVRSTALISPAATFSGDA